jgi:predicted HicB family RNase H-like nuclease
MGVERMSTKVLYVRIDEELYDKIVAKSKENGQSMATTANRLLQVAIEHESKYELRWVLKE